MGSDPAPEVADEPSGDGADEEDGGFDLGDFSGLIEEELSVQAESESETVSADLGGGMGLPMDLSGGGMRLEPPMDFAGGDDTGISDGGIELEQPLSDYTPEAPPAEQQEDQDDSPMDFGGVELPPQRLATRPETARVAGGDEVPRERKPRSRPSAPRRPKKAPVSMIVGVVVILGGGAAGFFAWQLFAGTEVVETPCASASRDSRHPGRTSAPHEGHGRGCRHRDGRRLARPVGGAGHPDPAPRRVVGPATTFRMPASSRTLSSSGWASSASSMT